MDNMFNKKITLSIILIFILCLSTIPSFANGNNTITPTLIDGTPYIPLSSINDFIGKDFNYNSSSNTIEFKTETKATASLSGTVSFFYNKYFPNKPDEGARVYLIPKGKKLTPAQAYGWSHWNDITKDCYLGQVDMHGNYSIPSIKPDTYLVLIGSYNSTRQWEYENPNEHLIKEDITDYVQYESHQSPKFTNEYDPIACLIYFGQFKYQIITIKDNDIVTVNHHFEGMNADNNTMMQFLK